MSGTIVNNVARASGTIAATPGGLDWSAAVVTASTVTVEAGKGYFINTTSNACTITLPAEAEIGDQIVIADYARTWADNAVTLDSNGLKFQGETDAYTVDYETVGQSLNIVFSDSTKGWLPVSDDAVAFEHGNPPTQRGIIAFGNNPSDNVSNLSNLISSSGVVATDGTGVGTARKVLAAAGYGGDKAIFGFGVTNAVTGITNLVNNSGTVQSDVSAVGTARRSLAAADYGVGLAIFAFGVISNNTGISNLVNNVGTVQSDVSAVGTARHGLAGNTYGGDKAIFAYGYTNAKVSISNLVNNSGVIASDVSGVGTARDGIMCCGFGGDKAIFAYGSPTGYTAVSNIVNNLGVVQADVSGVGTVRANGAACSYGGDKGIFVRGTSVVDDEAVWHSLSNLVNNNGVVGSDVTGVGTAQEGPAASGFSYSA